MEQQRGRAATFLDQPKTIESTPIKPVFTQDIPVIESFIKRDENVGFVVEEKVPVAKIVVEHLAKELKTALILNQKIAAENSLVALPEENTQELILEPAEDIAVSQIAEFPEPVFEAAALPVVPGIVSQEKEEPLGSFVFQVDEPVIPEFSQDDERDVIDLPEIVALPDQLPLEPVLAFELFVDALAEQNETDQTGVAEIVLSVIENIDSEISQEAEILLAEITHHESLLLHSQDEDSFDVEEVTIKLEELYEQLAEMLGISLEDEEAQEVFRKLIQTIVVTNLFERSEENPHDEGTHESLLQNNNYQTYLAHLAGSTEAPFTHWIGKYTLRLITI